MMVLATHVKLDKTDNQGFIFGLRGLGKSSIFFIMYSNKGQLFSLLNKKKYDYSLKSI